MDGTGAVYQWESPLEAIADRAPGPPSASSLEPRGSLPGHLEKARPDRCGEVRKGPEAGAGTEGSGTSQEDRKRSSQAQRKPVWSQAESAEARFSQEIRYP